VTSTMQRAAAVAAAATAALHGKASRFADDNGVATTSSSLPLRGTSRRGFSARCARGSDTDNGVFTLRDCESECLDLARDSSKNQSRFSLRFRRGCRCNK